MRLNAVPHPLQTLVHPDKYQAAKLWLQQAIKHVVSSSGHVTVGPFGAGTV